MKKYCFTEETKEFNGHILHRIKALKEVPYYGIKPGDLGGWIEREENLSHDGNAWVSDDALVCEDAQVRGNAWIYNNALVYGNAEVYGEARVYE